MWVQMKASISTKITHSEHNLHGSLGNLTGKNNMHVLLKRTLLVRHISRRMIMEDCCVHHVEFGVRNGDEFQRKFASQYKFVLFATRFLSSLKQWVLKSHHATVLVTQPITDQLSNDSYFVPWSSESIFDITKTDSVFNVALKVKNVENCVNEMTRSGVTVLKEPQTLKDSHGSVSFAVVKSCVGNVVHTLIQNEDYNGIFLPGFDGLSSNYDIESPLISHFDHIAFVLQQGQSSEVLDWYSRCFGMKRFLINNDENEESGFVIDTEEVGLRLKAFEYWKCSETGLTSDPATNGIKFVLAESLPGQGPNQVDEFLQHHGGPGIQHIGLHTDNIINAVSHLKQAGVEFAEPPYTYYTKVGKLEEIQEIGQNVEALRDNGILVDAEADPGELLNENESTTEETRYLLQKFTKCIFDKHTFFLEIIQRVGARGFGSGNITALWRSVQAYMNSQNTGEKS